MPHTRTAKKRLRQSKKRHVHNRAIKRMVSTYTKKFYALVEGGSVDDAQKAFNVAVKKWDQAGSKGIVHKNKVARKKSQLAKALHQKKAAGDAPAAETTSETSDD